MFNVISIIHSKTLTERASKMTSPDGIYNDAETINVVEELRNNSAADIVLVVAPCMEQTPYPPAAIPCLVASLKDHGYTASAISADMAYKTSLPKYR